MGETIQDATLEWLTQFREGASPVEVTFHGGEPLTAGIAFYRRFLDRLDRLKSSQSFRLAMQSNLWLLNDEYVELFENYRVYVGTSLDGPETINDLQRGKGYFQKTMRGVQLARAAGIFSGCIATLSAYSAGHWREILAFFEETRMMVSFHAAVNAGRWTLEPARFAAVLSEMMADFVARGGMKVRVEPLQSICEGIGGNTAGVCYLGDCLGKFYAIDPEGDIYPCQRLVGRPGFRLGNVKDGKPIDHLMESDTWKKLDHARSRMKARCGDCPFTRTCHGGCLHQAFLDAENRGDLVYQDPYCQTYQVILGRIIDLAVEDVFRDENLQVLVEGNFHGDNLLRRGPMAHMMGRERNKNS